MLPHWWLAYEARVAGGFPPRILSLAVGIYKVNLLK
jgi:hypothetical protein